MRTIAIIPARKGSKRLPEKNSKLLGGKPLAKWTIDCALKSQVFDDIIFSTDDKKLSEMAISSGCIVPGLRDESLAGDTSDLVSVCLDASEKVGLSSSDVIILLQPTSPFRKPETIRQAVHMIEDEEVGSVIGFSKTKISPEWLHIIDPKGHINSIVKDSKFKNQKSLSDYYTPNGLIYAMRVSTLIHVNSFYTQKTIPLICSDPIESIDIDEPSDWDFAQYCLEKSKDLKS